MAGEAGPKRLRRSDDRMVGGVAGGIAEYVDLDPTIVRVVFAVLLILGAFITWALVYGVLWLLMPEFETGAERASDVGGAQGGAKGGVDPSVVFAVVLLGLGVLLLSSRFTVGRLVGFGGMGVVWPLLLMLIGAVAASM